MPKSLSAFTMSFSVTWERVGRGEKRKKLHFKISTFIFHYICTLRINWNFLYRTLHTHLLQAHLQNIDLLLLALKCILEETRWGTGACFISCHSGYFNVYTCCPVLHDSLCEVRNFKKVSYIHFLKARHINSAPYCTHLQKGLLENFWLSYAGETERFWACTCEKITYRLPYFGSIMEKVL